MQLYEKWRPRTWQEVCGQEKVCKRLLAMKGRDSLAGKAYWIAGGSGQGKTTIARLLAAEVADDFFIQEIDAGALTVAQLRETEVESTISGWNPDKPGRAYIVNEAHGLRKDTIRQLLVTLERIPAHVVWIFTTTNKNEEALFEDILDASPLLSRCLRFDLARRDLAKPFAERCREIAQREGLDGQPIERYVKLAQECKNNFRAMLQEIESGRMAS